MVAAARHATTRWLGVLALVAPAACAGKVTASGGEGTTCTADRDCAAGACVSGTCATGNGTGGAEGSGGSVSGGASAGGSGAGGGSGTGGSNGGAGGGFADGGGGPSTDGGPDVMTEFCATGATATCGDWQKPTLKTSGPEPSIWRVAPVVGSGDLAVSVALSGTTHRGFTLPRDGGCLRPLTAAWENAGPSWSVSAAATGGGVTAALLSCAYKFACGNQLHVDGQLVASLDDALPSPNLYGSWKHALAVLEDGTVVVVSGPSGQGGGGITADTLLVARYRRDGSADGMRVSDVTEVLGGVAPLSGDAAAVLLHTVGDGGVTGSIVRRLGAGGELTPLWTSLPGMRVDQIASSGGRLLLAGSDGGPVVLAVDAVTGDFLWEEGVGSGMVVTALTGDSRGNVRVLVTTGGVAELLALDLQDGHVVADTPVPPAPDPDQSLSWAELAVSPVDDTALVTVGPWATACPGNPPFWGGP